MDCHAVLGAEMAGKVTFESQLAAAEVDVPVQDVQVNGTSILDAQGVANVPVASENEYGVVKVNNAGGLSGIRIENGTLKIVPVTSAAVKAGNGNWVQLVPSHQHESTFYGLAKAAGSDEKDSTLPVGQYTDEAKIAIQKMLGIYKPNYRLIKTIEITEATPKIYVVADDANLPFSLTDVIVRFEGVVSSAVSNTAISVNSGNTTNGEIPRVFVANSNSTTAQTRIIHLWIDGGKFFGIGSSASTPSNYNVSNIGISRDSYGLFDCDPIYELCMASANSHTFNSGTIKIYGR